MAKRRNYRINWLSTGRLFIYGLLLISSRAKSQDSSIQNKKIENTYIGKYNGLVTLKLGLNNSAEVFSVHTSGDSYVLKPNPTQIIRLYFNYRFISFFLSTAPRFLPGNNDDAIKGRSRGMGLGFNFNLHQWFSELSFSVNRGYYMENTKDFLPTWKPGDPYYQFPDLKITSFGGVTGFNTNPHHSLSAIWSQTERQLKSAGSFLPKLSYKYYVTNDLSAGTTQKSTNKIYFLAAATPAFGYVFTKLTTRFPTGDQITHSSSSIVQLDLRSGLGYNSNQYFFGSYLTVVNESFAQANTTAVNSNGQLFFQIFAGIRLKAPKLLEKHVPNW